MTEPASALIRVSHGLWRAPDDVGELSGRCAALLDRMPPGTVLGGMTAAALHGLWVPSSTVDRVEMIVTRAGVVPRELAHSRRREVRYRRRSLRADERCVVHGLPMATEARTWFDLAEELSLADLVACGDSVLRGETTHSQLHRMVVRGRRQRGVRTARAALPLLNGRSRSRPESLLRMALVLAGLPCPAVNEPIYTGEGGWLAEPDLSYGEAQLALEYVGADHATLRRMRRDLTRGIDLVRYNWEAMLFGPAEVFGRSWSIAPLVRTVLQRRAPDYLREWRRSQRVARNNAPLAE